MFHLDLISGEAALERAVAIVSPVLLLEELQRLCAGADYLSSTVAGERRAK